MATALAESDPFADLPPISLGGNSATPANDNPFDALPPLDLNAKGTPALSPHAGALANSAGDGYGMSPLKGAATAAIKGVGDIPGIVGNLKQAGDTVGDYALGAVQTLGGLRGSISEEAAKNAAAADAIKADARGRGIPVPSDYVPTGETFSNPVLARTGEYVPQSPLGRVGMAGVEAAVGAPAPGSVGRMALNAGENFAGGVAGQTATELTGNPVAGIAAGAGTQGLAHFGSNIAQHGTAAIADAIPPLTEVQKELAAKRQVGQELNASAVDPNASQSALQTGNPEIIPGSRGTLGPISGDTGLLNYEKSVAQSPAGKAAYDARMADQNRARQAAVGGIQPNGDVFSLSEGVKANAADADARSQAAVDAAKATAAQNTSLVDQATQAHVEGAQQAHQSALADIQALKPDASPVETATHFRALRDAMEADGAQRAAQAQGGADTARGAIAPNAQTPEQVGSALRTPFDERAQAASQAVSRLYDSLPKDMVAPTTDITAKVKDIQTGMLPEHSPISGEEARLYDLAGNYGDATPLANVNALRGSILSARSTLRQSDPQAYGRLGRLQSAVEASVDHAVENRAALDAIAVRRGTMVASDALPARMGRWAHAEDEWRNATQRPQALASGGANIGAVSGRSEGFNAGGDRGQSASGRGPGGDAGDQGISPVSGRASAGDSGQPEQVGAPALREANAAYREKKQTFDEGPVGEAFAKVGRGEAAYSNAELANKVFHGRATAGEDMRAYLKATGPAGVPAASDAAAYSFRDAAMRDGIVDPARASKWIAKHRVALDGLPANVRSGFETASGAQHAVEDAMARTRDSLSTFDKSEAGKVAGLTAGGDVVKHVGTILDGANRPEARLAELSAQAKGNPAAVDGLKRAVVEHVLDKFIPEGAEAKPDRMQSYIAAKRDVLSKIMSPAEIDALGSKAATASAAGDAVKDATGARGEALKATQQAGEASVKAAETSRKEMLSKYDKGVLGRLKGASGSEIDIINTVRRALNADNGATQMTALAKEVGNTSGGVEALKRAVAEVVRQDVQSTSEAGTSGLMQMKRADLAKFMTKRTDALKAAGLSDQQIGVLRAVTDDSLQANRIISATSAKGGSDTNQNRAMAAKMAHGGHQSILGHIVVDAALATAGHAVGGIMGAFIGKTLGDKVMGAMREAGMDRVQKLRIEAILHPELGLALMREFPAKPNQGSAAELGLRLRQMSLAGILASQKH